MVIKKLPTLNHDNNCGEVDVVLGGQGFGVEFCVLHCYMGKRIVLLVYRKILTFKVFWNSIPQVPTIIKFNSYEFI